MRLPNPALAALLQREQPQACVHCAGRASVGLSLEDPAADFAATRCSPSSCSKRCAATRRAAVSCCSPAPRSMAIPATLPVGETDKPAPLSPYGYHKLAVRAAVRGVRAALRLAHAQRAHLLRLRAGLRRQVVWDICERVLTSGALSLHGTGQRKPRLHPRHRHRPRAEPRSHDVAPCQWRGLQRRQRRGGDHRRARARGRRRARREGRSPRSTASRRRAIR